MTPCLSYDESIFVVSSRMRSPPSNLHTGEHVHKENDVEEVDPILRQGALLQSSQRCRFWRCISAPELPKNLQIYA